MESGKPMENGKEYRMRLNSALVERTLNQFEAQVIPDSHPVIPQLKGVFGDHTFFLNRSGLNIVEPTEAPEAGIQAGNVVELASWTSTDPPKLAPHEPISIDVVVVLETEH
jgi:hypothetical protein